MLEKDLMVALKQVRKQFQNAKRKTIGKLTVAVVNADAEFRITMQFYSNLLHY